MIKIKTDHEILVVKKSLCEKPVYIGTFQFANQSNYRASYKIFQDKYSAFIFADIVCQCKNNLHVPPLKHSLNLLIVIKNHTS